MTSICNRRHAPPKASAMVESLRGLGYTTASALADIIDNSLAAGATRVALQFVWDDIQSHVSILDDGSGMSADELDLAMRLGALSPLEERAQGDLGRFGLGLKTASFSQCRRLTVRSVRDGADNALRWDLDELSASADDGWYMLEGVSEQSRARVTPLDGVSHGTLVLWENLDRVVTAGYSQQNFLDLIDVVERHLAMVFHRYLDGSRGERFQIVINGRRIDPWDPFLRSHPATWSSPVEHIATGNGVVDVQCHVLPHQDRLGEREYVLAAGPEGWTAQQGFYVYRNERLLVAGGWLGLGHGRAWTREESHRLARIRVDIPNSADQDWKIDIRKSMARPPVGVRGQLMRLAEDARERARKVFAHRGQVNRCGPVTVAELWQSVQTKEGIRYRIHLEHPAVSDVLAEAGGLEPQIRAMLRLIEETIPVQRVWLDTAEGRDVPLTGFSGSPPDEVRSVLDVVYRNMVNRKGMTSEMAKKRETFRQTWIRRNGQRAELPVG